MRVKKISTRPRNVGFGAYHNIRPLGFLTTDGKVHPVLVPLRAIPRFSAGLDGAER
jgi:hypothetical protein